MAPRDLSLIQGSNLLAAEAFLSLRHPETVAHVRLNPDLSLDLVISTAALQRCFLNSPCSQMGKFLPPRRLRGMLKASLNRKQASPDLKADGSFDRRIFQTAFGDWQAPAFGSRQARNHHPEFRDGDVRPTIRNSTVIIRT
jgi:hypothetical protein